MRPLPSPQMKRFWISLEQMKRAISAPLINFMAQSDEAISHPGSGNVRRNQSDQIVPWCDQSGALGECYIRRRNTHQAGSFIMSPSSCIILPILSRDMLIALIIWFLIDRLSSITIWWTGSISFSAVAGHLEIGWPSRLSHPVRNSLVKCCTVDEAGA